MCPLNCPAVRMGSRVRRCPLFLAFGLSAGFCLRVGLSLAVVLTLSCKKDDWIHYDPLGPWDIASAPAWSPDAHRIYYTDVSGNVCYPCFSDTLGNRQRLFAHDAIGGDLSFEDISSDGRNVLLTADHQIYAVRLLLDGTADETTLVSLTQQGFYFYPRYSPDGRRIAVSGHGADDPGGFCGVYVMNADGSEQRRIPGTVGDAVLPDWAPDARRLVYVGYPRSTPCLMIMDTTGDQSAEFLDDTLQADCPAWSPLGNVIAYTHYPHHRGSMICLGDTLGHMQGEFTSGLMPAWSPDGHKLAFVDLEPKGQYGTLFMIDVGTKRRRQILWK